MRTQSLFSPVNSSVNKHYSISSGKLTTARRSEDRVNMDNQTMPGLKLTITEELLEEFTRWLREEEHTSESTIRKYMYYLPKLTSFTFSSKADVIKAFELMGYTKVSREALSRLFTFVERKLEGYEELVYRLQKAMPKAKKSKADTYVPPDTKVLELGKCLAAKGPVYSCTS